VRPLTLALLLVVVVVGSYGCGTGGGTPPVAAAAPPPAPPPPPKPLFDRLGGKPAVEAVVDEFLARVSADKRINGRFFNTDVKRLRTLLVEFVCSATGGPCQYTGRDMKTAHAGFQLVQEEFDALVEDLVGALDKFNVPRKEKDEVLGALGPLAKDIVHPPPPEAAQHDDSLARQATAKVAELRAAGKADAADLLETAIAARVRGQRSYAEQLYSAAERLAPGGALATLDPLFRAGAPERITTALKTLPMDTPAQPKDAAGGSEEDPETPKNGSLAGTVTIEGASGPSQSTLAVVALEPASGKWKRRTPKQRTIEQRDRQFAPRMLAVSAGSTVSFPNFDPIFHNVFSTSHARAFDLGIYKNGETRDVTFPKEGLIGIGCNLHANMSAHVVVVAAPHYVVTDGRGAFKFRSLRPGKYKLKAWAEDTAEPVTQTIEITSGENTVKVNVPRASAVTAATDKFGLPRGRAP
jgi:hemoglobin